MDGEVLIVLATFNGARFLPEQLASIEHQTMRSWHLIACDDGSTDNTSALLSSFQAKNPTRVQLLDRPPTGSPAGNFFRILREAPPASYVALCDQDDVWADDKLQQLVAECRRLEQKRSMNVPCLVYSDLSVVDSDLGLMAPSFMREVGAVPERVTFGSLLVENSIPGCAMLFNRALLLQFQSFQGDLSRARMHDWWLGLLASSLGAMSFVETPLVKYRQHNANSAGSVRRRGVQFAVVKLRSPARLEASANIEQAQLLVEAHGSQIAARALTQATTLANFDRLNRASRVLACVRLGILKNTFPRRVFQLLRV